jgi:O-antigen biosynthesis protein
MRVALLSRNARAGDAIGNQLAEKVAFFLERGADVRLLVSEGELLHPALRPYTRLCRSSVPEGEDWDYLAAADLLVVEYGQSYPLLDVLPLLAGGKPRVLFDYHGVTPAAFGGAHHREALERGARRRGLVWFADAAVVHSRFAARELAQPTGFPAERTQVLGLALDTQHFRPGPPRRRFRDELGLRQATVLLFVGRLAPNKRVPVLVEALARLHDLEPPVHAVVVGNTSDTYQEEARRCRERADQLGVADRLHFFGRLSDEDLRDAYRSADVFVMPSRHEGFCLPVVEAMACGLPVVAARAGALPETVSDAGLTFEPDDADDLARQVRRVLHAPGGAGAGPGTPLRVAVVAHRFGGDFVGGAEASLRTIARVLAGAGHAVEVFTTCNRAEADWGNHLPEGTTADGRVPVHRFRIDPHDRPRHLEAFRTVLEAEGDLPDAAEEAYLTHSLHSGRLLDALRRRAGEFDAALVGPYLFGLTHDIAREFRERVLLLPCFHDEPLARLRVWRRAYAEVGGLLYHSPEEQAFAERELGLNHPGAVCCGTLVDEAPGDARRGREAAGTDRRYLVYAGRYSAHKNLPLLLDYAGRYHAAHPGRFHFVFLGQGEVVIPGADWVRDRGFVDAATKRDILAGADALVQLSACESLSLVALEAWAQGVPVLAHERCEALAGHLRRGGGGRSVDSYERFADALDELWKDPGRWQALGGAGREYARSAYGSRDGFVRRLEEAVGQVRLPLAERLRRRGRERAARYDRAAWRAAFGRLVEEALDRPARPCRSAVAVESRAETRRVPAGAGTVVVPVRVRNRGTYPLVPDGPGRTRLHCQVTDSEGKPCGPATDTDLPDLVLPGRATAAAVPVAVPALPGEYVVRIAAEGEMKQSPPPPAEPCLRLVVEARGGEETGCSGPLLDNVQAALAEAQRRQRLPDDYLDVTEGFLADAKRWAKRKLLQNFKRAYVDVLSRQQSAFNGHVLTALHELAECCALLDHARGTEPAALLQRLSDELAASRRQCAELERRLARLERRRRRKGRRAKDGGAA